jgi:Spy/CpxP family protein refolding chaperone
MALGRTAKYYRDNPDSRKVHQETSKKAAAKPEAKRKRAEANKARKELGIPKGSPIDASHKNGKIVKEHRKENRARGGALKR